MQTHPDSDPRPIQDDRQTASAAAAAQQPGSGTSTSEGMPIPCPICGTAPAQQLCVVDEYRVLRCAQCAADFVSPAPDEATLRAYYDRPAWFEGGERGGYQNYDAQTAPLLPFFDTILDEFPQDGSVRSVLDIGCGYGTHLEMAHQRGWKCFGVEVSAHARQVIGERHGHKFFIADDVEHIIPHEFDLIVMFDVIEHLSDPYRLFYSLFAKGAITPKTMVVIATPNARSAAAMSDPSGWAYRHPPSHLTYFSAQALTTLLQRLHFRSIEVRGLHEETAARGQPYKDEFFPINDSLAAFDGLVCKASGSDFAGFMQERYVPGTWSKLAEYEHLPRYLFARALAAGRRVLDFGCGTGYGTSILAQSAQAVIGIDIDAAALEWARGHHKASNLSFERRADLGASLPAASFDFISCFEMIEHVPEALQIEAVRNFARLLSEDGLAVISTPNPETTKLYGANPYHIREMNRIEFKALLNEHFQHVELLEQYIQPSVFITPTAVDQHVPIHPLTWEPAPKSNLEPAVFIAVCSHRPIPRLDGACFFDFRTDFIAEQLQLAKELNRIRFDHFQVTEQAAIIPDLRAIVTEQADDIQELMASVAERQSTIVEKESAIALLDQQRRALEAVLTSRERELVALRQSNWYKLGETLRQDKLSLKKIARVGYYSTACLTPQRLKSVLRPAVTRLRRLLYERHTHPAHNIAPHLVKRQAQVHSGRPRVLHVIGNFMLGGSSRLVVDLIEGLGDKYDQKVVTSHLPSPSAYAGVDVTEFRSPQSPDDVLAFLYEYNPEIMHIHYWGETDWWWYDIFFRAAQELGCRVIENINTPVDAYKADFIDRYVHVSNYVQQHFGDGSARNMTIYPGIDFSLFSRAENQPLAADCIGMVYRLETDKLNEQSIDVFIKVAQKRPQTKVIIVGGGTYLEPYRRAVQAAGLASSFEFTGYVEYARLPALYERMSIFVAPVWKESFGQVSPFAMNLGIPVVGYRVGGLSEIVDDDSLLAQPGNSDELADLVIRLLDDPARCRQIGARNHARAQALFSVEAMTEAYGTLYAELIEAKQ